MAGKNKLKQSIKAGLSITGAAGFAFANSALADIAPVLSTDLSDVVESSWGLTGDTQGARTPNSLGGYGFMPFAFEEDSLFFADIELDINLSDFSDQNSSINPELDGTPVTTSSRIGRRWLNDDRSWMYGINAGYDTRPIQAKSGNDIDFQQYAVGFEAVSEKWDINVYGLIPSGDTRQDASDTYEMAALNTYGVDLGFDLNDSLKAYAGYYYQSSELDDSEGSGVKGSVDYGINDSITLNTTISYDPLFDTRVSVGFTSLLGATKKKAYSSPVISSLSERVRNRKVRTHGAAKESAGTVCSTRTNTEWSNYVTDPSKVIFYGTAKYYECQNRNGETTMRTEVYTTDFIPFITICVPPDIGTQTENPCLEEA